MAVRTKEKSGFSAPATASPAAAVPTSRNSGADDGSNAENRHIDQPSASSDDIRNARDQVVCRLSAQRSSMSDLSVQPKQPAVAHSSATFK
jgi:hypothetical protein